MAKDGKHYGEVMDPRTGLHVPQATARGRIDLLRSLPGLNKRQRDELNAWTENWKRANRI